METNNKEDQATQLKNLVEELNQQSAAKEEIDYPFDNNDTFRSENQNPVIDVLNLPPRKDVHLSNSKRASLKVSKPLVRFLLVCLIIAVILGSTFYFLSEDILTFF